MQEHTFESMAPLVKQELEARQASSRSAGQGERAMPSLVTVDNMVNQYLPGLLTLFRPVLPPGVPDAVNFLVKVLDVVAQHAAPAQS